MIPWCIPRDIRVIILSFMQIVSAPVCVQTRFIPEPVMPYQFLLAFMPFIIAEHINDKATIQ